MKRLAPKPPHLRSHDGRAASVKNESMHHKPWNEMLSPRSPKSLHQSWRSKRRSIDCRDVITGSHIMNSALQPVGSKRSIRPLPLYLKMEKRFEKQKKKQAKEEE